MRKEFNENIMGLMLVNTVGLIFNLHSEHVVINILVWYCDCGCCTVMNITSVSLYYQIHLVITKYHL